MVFFCFQSLLHASTNKLDRRHIFLNRTLNSCFDKENDRNFLNPQYSIQLWLLSNCILNFIEGHWIVERLNGAQEDKGCVDFTRLWKSSESLTPSSFLSRSTVTCGLGNLLSIGGN